MVKSKILKYIQLAIGLILFFPVFSWSENITAQNILQWSDEIRNPQKDYRVTARIISQKPDYMTCGSLLLSVYPQMKYGH